MATSANQLYLVTHAQTLMYSFMLLNIVSSMVSQSGEVVDALHRGKIDFCCAQDTRWKGECARMLGANGRRYKFFWQGCNKGTAGVGVFIAERWIDSMAIWSESMCGSCM